MFLQGIAFLEEGDVGLDPASVLDPVHASGPVVHGPVLAVDAFLEDLAAAVDTVALAGSYMIVLVDLESMHRLRHVYLDIVGAGCRHVDAGRMRHLRTSL